MSEYSAEWSEYFELEKSNILNLIGCDVLAIEHVGSTSVPGLKAKPIIDIAIEVESKEILEKLIHPLTSDGYTYFGEREIKDDFCFMKGPEENRTHKVHVSLKGSHRMKDFLKFRNTLRGNPALLKEYENLKVQLAEKYPSNGKKYTELKSRLVERLVNS